MFLTLCVDVGWKPAEDGKGEVYVIQIHPEQGEQMIKNKSSVTCGIDERAKEVRVQFGNDILLKDPTTNTLTPNEATTENANLHSPPSPNTLLSPYSPKPPPTVSDVGPTAPGIVTTSLDSPLEVSVELPNQQAKPAPKKEETPPQTGSDEGTESYLTAAIILGIVSAGLFAMVVYLIWIHLELRRRYQALLDRVLTDSATDLSKGDLAELLAPGLANSPGKGGETAPWTASSEDHQENASTSEEPSKKSTLVESAEDAANAKESKPNLDGMDSLLQNTNQAIAQVPGEAELEAVDPRKKDEEPETVYGLPETSDEESPEESDDDNDIEDDDAGSWGDVK